MVQAGIEVLSYLRWADELMKAIAAHPSQLQHRSRSGQFAPFHYGRSVPREASGRFTRLLPPPDRVAARKLAVAYADNLHGHLERHLVDIGHRRIDVRMAAQRGKADIAEYYTLLYRTGMQHAGNPGVILTPQDTAVINQVAGDEGDFWSKFMRDVEAGAGVWGYERRLQAYRTAALHAFWAGFIVGDQRPSRRIVWRLGESEHCASCRSAADRGPMTSAEFVRDLASNGILPQSGSLDCKGIHCRCRLVSTSTRT